MFVYWWLFYAFTQQQVSAIHQTLARHTRHRIIVNLHDIFSRWKENTQNTQAYTKAILSKAFEELSNWILFFNLCSSPSNQRMVADACVCLCVHIFTDINLHWRHLFQWRPISAAFSSVLWCVRVCISCDSHCLTLLDAFFADKTCRFFSRFHKIEFFFFFISNCVHFSLHVLFLVQLFCRCCWECFPHWWMKSNGYGAKNKMSKICNVSGFLTVRSYRMHTTSMHTNTHTYAAYNENAFSTIVFIRYL